MATLADLKKVKIESELPKNSTEVVSNVTAKIRTVNVQQDDGSVTVFINLETADGKRYSDAIKFKDNIENTLRYFSMHTGHIFKQFGSEYKSFTESFDQAIDQLKAIQKAGKTFTMSTVQSSYNSDYVEVLYGDEEARA